MKSAWGRVNAEWVNKSVKVIDGPLTGAVGVVRRRSQRTGALTVELTQPFGVYTAGSNIIFHPYEVEKTNEQQEG